MVSSKSRQRPSSSKSRQQPSSSKSRQQPRAVSSESVSSSESASSSKSVSFLETANVFFFNRQPSFDRWPRDGKGYGLGMQATHFYQNEQPVSKGGTGHRLVPYVQCSQRKRLLGLHTLPAAEHQMLNTLKKELKGLYLSDKSGCSCVGDCLPETCECLMTGVECCQSRAFLQVRCCCERRWCPTTSELPSYRKRARRIARYRRKKLASLCPDSP